VQATADDANDRNQSEHTPTIVNTREQFEAGIEAHVIGLTDITERI
jgi:hypothetical protein